MATLQTSKNIILTFDGAWGSIYRDFDGYVSQEPAGEQLLHHISLDHSRRYSSMIDGTAKDAYRWILDHYSQEDKIFLFSFTNTSYLALKALAKLLWPGERTRSGASGTNIPISCIGVVYDNQTDDRRIIDDMSKDMPRGVHLLLGFELSRAGKRPDANAMLRNYTNGANISREVWYFDRSVEISTRVIMEWIAIHTQDDIKFNETVGFFSQLPKWAQKIRELQPSSTPSASLTNALGPAGLETYELHMYDHSVKNRFTRKQVHMRYMVWYGDRNLV